MPLSLLLARAAHSYARSRSGPATAQCFYLPPLPQLTGNKEGESMKKFFESKKYKFQNRTKSWFNGTSGNGHHSDNCK